jgi:hypothetical protein
MATISRTGIAGGGTISPAHITNIIDALDGSSSTTTVVASGSFSGSLTGHSTSATSASYAITSTSASYAITATSASYAITATSASYAATASYVANVSSFPFTGSAIISGSLRVTGSLNVSAGIATPQFTINAANTASAGQHLVLDLNLIAKSGGTGQFIVPSGVPSVTPAAGALYWDDANSALYIYQGAGSGWRSVLLT